MKQAILEKMEYLVKEYLSLKAKEEQTQELSVGVGFPDFTEKETMAALKSILELNISQGKMVKEFEGMFSKFVGTKYGAAVNSGTSANLLALTALLESGDLKKGDEVIIPASTFQTVASPILQVGLVPVFVDVQQSSYNIDPKEARKAISPKTKLLMPVHSLGNPCEMKEILEIAKEKNLKVLEDCCEAHASKIGSKVVGSFGDLASISFFVAHNMTTGEGGMIFYSDDKFDEIIRSLREFGRINQSIGRFDYSDKFLGHYDKRYVFTRLGYNFRMTDIAASIGIEQLKKINDITEKRVNNVLFYNKKLKEFEDYLLLPEIRPNTTHTFYTYPLTVKENASFSRQEIVDFLEENKIETRPFFSGCIPDQPAMQGKPQRIVGDLQVSRYIKYNTFFIGCHQKLGKKETSFVVEKMAEFMQKNA